jgi:hypothetical protein
VDIAQLDGLILEKRQQLADAQAHFRAAYVEWLDSGVRPQSIEALQLTLTALPAMLDALCERRNQAYVEEMYAQWLAFDE